MKDKEKQIEEMQKFEFKVIDKETGKEADIGKIALKEDWAKNLMYCDMQGFAITEDGGLILLDECGKYEFCPNDRFEIVPKNSMVLSLEEWATLHEQYAQALYRKGTRTRKETAEKIYLQAKAIVDATKHIVQGREYLHIDALKEIVKSCGVEIKE